MTQEKRYKEFVISHNDKDEILPQGSQIFIKYPNLLLKIKVGWSDISYQGKLIAGQTIKTIGEGMLIRIPIQNEVKNMTQFKEIVVPHNLEDFPDELKKSLPLGSEWFGIYEGTWINKFCGRDFTRNIYNDCKTNTNWRGYKIRIPIQKEVKTVTQTWQDLVDNILDTWTTQNKSFTAYEVSVQVQKDLEQDGLDFVRHRDMRDYIHTEMNKTNSYQKVYHDFGTYKAFQYIPLQTNIVPQSPTPQFSVATVTNKSTRWPDKRGSITTPKKLVSQLGWNRGQTIYIINDHDGLHLTDQKQTQSKTTYTIDKNLNIRVTKRHLLPKTNYTVFIQDKEIIVV